MYTKSTTASRRAFRTASENWVHISTPKPLHDNGIPKSRDQMCGQSYDIGSNAIKRAARVKK